MADCQISSIVILSGIVLTNDIRSVIILIVVMLSVIVLSDIMLTDTIMNVVMLIVISSRVVLLIVVKLNNFCAEHHYAEW